MKAQPATLQTVSQYHSDSRRYVPRRCNINNFKFAGAQQFNKGKVRTCSIESRQRSSVGTEMTNGSHASKGDEAAYHKIEYS